MTKKYNIIYADPPWSHRDRMSYRELGAGFKYSLLTIPQIQNLPIPSICHDDCVLFLWTPCPVLVDALNTVYSWGFDFKTVAFSWIKKNKKSGTNFFGLGHWTRANPEYVLLGAKGKIRAKTHSVSSVVEHILLRHSEKPAIFRDKIVELMGDLPRVELFAREKVPGWDSWGDEVACDFELAVPGDENDKPRVGKVRTGV
jgi:N6-adenosine-specific RNA methylase IME4